MGLFSSNPCNLAASPMNYIAFTFDLGMTRRVVTIDSYATSVKVLVKFHRHAFFDKF